MRGAKRRYTRVTPDLSQNQGFYELAPGSGRSGGKGQVVAERQERGGIKDLTEAGKGRGQVGVT